MTPARLRVLVVDDSAEHAAAFCRQLALGGHDVEAVRVSSSVEMKSALERGRFDLVLSEYHLECFSGLQALRLVQASGHDLPLIIVSAHIGEDRAIELMRAGARDFVTKERPGRLLPAVERELRDAHERRERRRAEDALRAREQQYRELFENASDMVFTIDLQGRFTSVNRACEAITGYTREEALTLRVADVLAPEDQAVARRLSGIPAGHDTERRLMQLTIVGKDGRRIAAEVSWCPIVRDGAVVSIEAIARDLTERRRLEEQLRQAQKMEAVGRLAGGIAHDFNNLLMAVTGYSELLVERLSGNETLRGNAEEIRKAAARAAALTRQLLTFSRKQVMRPAVIDLNAIVAELDSMLRRLIGEDITFSTMFGPGPAYVKADRGHIEQVIMNLVVNARDAMPGGGRLQVRTGRLSVDMPENDGYPGLPRGEYVTLEVHDTGVGMSEEVQSHLFEPFFTTKDAGKGTGLGLSTAYGIVAQSGGRIIAQSTEGRGSTFRVLLPAEQAPVSKVASRRGFGSLPRGTETVLLVEDEQGVRELVRDFLLRCGYTVLEAADPREAIVLFEAHREELQLLITDVVMPQMNGRELAERLLARRPALGVLYMSGYTDDQVLAYGVGQGAGFLQKPFTPDVLARKVREVLDATPLSERPR